MAYKIKINKKFEIESQQVYTYLAEKWGFTVADGFIETLYKRIQKLVDTPYSGAPAEKIKNVRKIIITKHNKLYYRVKGKTITILTLISSGKDPKKNKYE